MNNGPDSTGSSNTGATLMGFALGAVIGAGVALLLAPESGKRTRERLATTARRLGNDAVDRFDQARETVSDLGTDAKSAVKAGQEAFIRDLGTRGSRSERRLAQDGDGGSVLDSVARPGGEISR